MKTVICDIIEAIANENVVNNDKRNGVCMCEDSNVVY